MPEPHDLDGILITWGDRLFYPGNRVVHARTPKLRDLSRRQRADAIRQRIEATVLRRAPQVMVKVTGGGRGMKAIAAHLRYISKNGRLDSEDEHGETARGKESLRELSEDWRFGGSQYSIASTVVALSVAPLSPCSTGLVSIVAMPSASAVRRTRCAACTESSVACTSQPTILRLYRSRIRYMWNHMPITVAGR